jgi:hypothetical protein
VSKQSPLIIREQKYSNGGKDDKEIYVVGLSEFRVSSPNEILKLLYMGDKKRSKRCTEYNEQSSRSHAILQLRIGKRGTCTWRVSIHHCCILTSLFSSLHLPFVEVESIDDRGAKVIRKSKLNLVDLAGSERWNITSSSVSSLDSERGGEDTRTALRMMGKQHISELTSINKRY